MRLIVKGPGLGNSRPASAWHQGGRPDRCFLSMMAMHGPRYFVRVRRLRASACPAGWFGLAGFAKQLQQLSLESDALECVETRKPVTFGAGIDGFPARNLSQLALSGRSSLPG